MVKKKKSTRKKVKRASKAKESQLVPENFKFEKLEEDPMEQVKKINVKPETVAKLMTSNEGNHCGQSWYCKQAKYCLAGLIVVLAVLAIVGMYSLNSTGNATKSVGAYCISDDQCEFACVNGECVPGESGNRCSTNRDCSNGQRCSDQGICGGPGAWCMNDNQCASKSCIQGTCQGTLASGKECKQDGDCKSGKCESTGSFSGKFCR